jgi:hypothetical protein
MAMLVLTGSGVSLPQLSIENRRIEGLTKITRTTDLVEQLPARHGQFVVEEL